MASTNPEAMTNAQGEFMPHKPRDEPLETKGVSSSFPISSQNLLPEVPDTLLFS